MSVEPVASSERLARIEVKLDALKEALTHDRARRDDHEMRIRLLEKWRYAFPVSLIVSLGSAAGLVIQGVM